MEYPPDGNGKPNQETPPLCPCGKGDAPAWVITCPVHGDPRIRERFPKRNERLNKFIFAAKREKHQIISKGTFKFILIDPIDGHPIFVWMRGKVKSFRGNPLKGLDRNERFVYRMMRDKLNLDCRIM